MDTQISFFVNKLEEFGFTDIDVSEPIEDKTNVKFINTNETEFNMSIDDKSSFTSFKPLGRRSRKLGTSSLKDFDFVNALTL